MFVSPSTPMPQAKINIAALYAALDARRRTQGASWREIAQELDISASTFSRMATGARPDVDSFATLLVWLGMEATQFTDHPDLPDRGPDPSAMFASYLRSSGEVTDAQAQALDSILQAAYRSIVDGGD
jgi:transcriptional regulator with XRE-family HTH domain